MSAFDYPPGASTYERELIDARAGDHGQDERDGRHEEHVR